MSEEVHLSSVMKESGEILFIYSDKYSVYTVYRPYLQKKMFVAICDKRLFIERAEYLELPEWFFNYSSIRFFKPKISNESDISFPGVVVVDGVTYRFELKPGEESVLSEMEEGFDPTAKQAHLLLSVLNNFEVIHGIQNRERFYFVGIDQSVLEEEHPVYGVVDMLSGKLETVYYLYSDIGEIHPACVTIDFHERNVYVVGKMKVFDNADVVVDEIPYLEQFMLKA